MKNHTLGPWEVLASETLDSVAVARQKKMSLPLALLQKDSFTDNRVANARLIAAAPEMLEALEGIVKNVGGMDDIARMFEKMFPVVGKPMLDRFLVALNAADAAIAKAKGDLK